MARVSENYVYLSRFSHKGRVMCEKRDHSILAALGTLSPQVVQILGDTHTHLHLHLHLQLHLHLHFYLFMPTVINKCTGRC